MKARATQWNYHSFIIYKSQTNGIWVMESYNTRLYYIAIVL